MPPASGGPKPAFYVVMMVLILGVIGYGVYRFKDRLPGSGDSSISADELAQMKGGVEAPDDASLTTFKEYDKLKFQEAGRMPEVKGVSNYEPLADNTVVFALNVWAGWAPIILANNGFAAGKVWRSA
jgi:NitT/TauT family transport system substrate-binding protein